VNAMAARLHGYRGSRTSRIRTLPERPAGAHAQPHTWVQLGTSESSPVVGLWSGRCCSRIPRRTPQPRHGPCGLPRCSARRVMPMQLLPCSLEALRCSSGTQVHSRPRCCNPERSSKRVARRETRTVVEAPVRTPQKSRGQKQDGSETIHTRVARSSKDGVGSALDHMKECGVHCASRSPGT
jgi:hypothetical protein